MDQITAIIILLLMIQSWGLNMYLNKKEADWIQLLVNERLNRIDHNIFECENTEDKIYIIKRTSEEREALNSVLYKS